MKQVISCIMLSALFLIPVFAQENTFCPDVKIISPNMVMSGETLIFRASFGSRNPDEKPEYKWKVSAGEIEAGQGTSEIRIGTAGLSDLEITATVEIKGFPKGCAKTFSGKGFVKKSVENIDLECYGNLSLFEEAGRLDSALIALKNDSGLIAHFYIFTRKNASSNEINARISRILHHLSGKRKLAKNRLVFVVSDDIPVETRICIWMKEKVEAGCQDCRIIRGEDFNPKKFNK